MLVKQSKRLFVTHFLTLERELVFIVKNVKITKNDFGLRLCSKLVLIISSIISLIFIYCIIIMKVIFSFDIWMVMTLCFAHLENSPFQKLRAIYLKSQICIRRLIWWVADIDLGLQKNLFSKWLNLTGST